MNDMLGKTRSSCLTALLLAVLLAEILTFFAILKPRELLPPWSPQPPTYNGIVVGETTFTHALELMGPGVFKVEASGDFYVAQYRLDFYSGEYDPRLNSWNSRVRIEIWADRAGGVSQKEAIVQAIYIVDGYSYHSDFQTLRQVVSRYGRPDFVTWSDQRFWRLLFYSRLGLAFKVPAPRYSEKALAWSNTTKIDSFLLFKPMSLRQFREMEWPQPVGRIFTHPEDTFPLDPFDWSSMPERVPADVPIHFP